MILSRVRTSKPSRPFPPLLVFAPIFVFVLTCRVAGEEYFPAEEMQGVLTNIPTETNVSILPFLKTGPSKNNPGIDLLSAIKQARERSLELSLAFTQHQIEEEQHRLAYRRFFPRVSLGYSRNETVIYHQPDTYTQRISLAIEQEIYDRGKRTSDLRTEEKTLQHRRRLLRVQEEELELQVVGVYLKALGLHLQREILTRAIGTAHEHGRIAHAELALGQITESDYLSLLLKEKDLELEQATLDREEEQTLFELRTLLGCPDQQIVPTGSIDPNYTGFLPLEGEERYLTKAIQNSTELEELAIQRESLHDRVQQVHLSYLPSLALQVELSMAGREFPLTQPGLSIALKLAWDTPVVPFSLGMQIGKEGYYERRRGLDGTAQLGENLEELYSVRLADMNLKRAEVQYSQRLEEIRFTLKQAFSLLREKSQTLKLLREKDALLEKKIEIQRLKVSLGEVTRLEFLEAEIERFRSQRDTLRAITDLFLQEMTILKLCGLGTFGRYPFPLRAEAPGSDSTSGLDIKSVFDARLMPDGHSAIDSIPVKDR